MFEISAKFEDGWSVDKGEEKAKKAEIKPLGEHRLIFAKEKRRGKLVTVVKPFYLEKKELQALLKKLKKKLGTGGTLKDKSLESQGDIIVTLKEELKKVGFNN